MGKGDKKTKRGKIFSKSYGKYRPKSKKLRQIEKADRENTETKKEDKE